MWPFSSASTSGTSSGAGGSSSFRRDRGEAAAAPFAPHPLPPGVSTADGCPVDEGTRAAWLATQKGSGSGAGASAAADATRSSTPSPSFLSFLPGNQHTGTSSTSSSPRSREDENEARRVAALSKTREVSSIPRAGGAGDGYNGGEGDGGGASSLRNDTSAALSSSAAAERSSPQPHSPPSEEGEASASAGNWVYPSPAQFYAAMARKQHNPNADDMPIVVSIHNAVNERAWAEIVAWERGWAGRVPQGDGGGQADEQGTGKGKGRWREPAEACGGLKLVSFTGKPRDLTWRAWARTLLGYEAPFDRHDWIVDRCGTRMRYIIDFYTGRPTVAARTSPTGGPVQNLAFFLDVRPAPDSVEGWAMRAHRTWLRLIGSAPAPGPA